MIRANNKWLVVGLLWMVCLLNYADRQAIFSVFPVLKSEFALSDVQLGIIGGSFMWIYAAALPFAGWIGDRVSRKFLILGGLCFWSLVTLGTAFCTGYRELVAVRALEGFGEAFYFPASMSMISNYHTSETRSRAMSFHQSSVYAGTVLGGTAAGFFAQHFGWRSGFYFFGGCGVLLAVVLLTVLKEPARNLTEKIPLAREAGRFLHRPIFWVLVGVFVGANFVAAIFLTWLPSFLNRRFGMNLTMSGLNATLWLQAASVLGVITGGVLADQRVKKNFFGRMEVQAMGLLAGVPFIFFTGWTLSVPLLVVAMIGFGFFKGIYDANIWASLHDVVSPARRASAVGFMNAIGWFGGGMAPVAIAAMSQKFEMGACLSGTSAIYLVVGLVLFAVVRNCGRAPAHAAVC